MHAALPIALQRVCNNPKPVVLHSRGRRTQTGHLQFGKSKLDKHSICNSPQSRFVTKQAVKQLVCSFYTPAAVVQHCLTLLRKSDVESFTSFLLPGAVLSQPPALKIGKTLVVVEEGPLATCADVLDAAARRVLPSNLLRRSQLLSCLTTNYGHYSARVAVTGFSGEEVVLKWMLELNQGRLMVASVKLDIGDQSLPQVPHPRYPPESIIQAQLAGLRHDDVHSVASFNSWRPTVRKSSSSISSWATQHSMLDRALKTEQFKILTDFDEGLKGAAGCD